MVQVGDKVYIVNNKTFYEDIENGRWIIAKITSVEPNFTDDNCNKLSSIDITATDDEGKTYSTKFNALDKFSNGDNEYEISPPELIKIVLKTKALEVEKQLKDLKKLIKIV